MSAVRNIRNNVFMHTVAHLFMRTENRANLKMRRLFCFENTSICDAIHAVLIENEKFLLGITKYNVFYEFL